MPYVSSAQEKFFNANRDKLEAKGVNVDEWNKASKGLKLPEHVKKNIIKKVIKKKDGKGGPPSIILGGDRPVTNIPSQDSIQRKQFFENIIKTLLNNKK